MKGHERTGQRRKLEHCMNMIPSKVPRKGLDRMGVSSTPQIERNEMPG